MMFVSYSNLPEAIDMCYDDYLLLLQSEWGVLPTNLGYG
jgi:hypothetical protein